MVEYLALPAWQTPPTTVDAWVVALSEAAGPVIVSRESSTVMWIEVAPLRIRGFVVIENEHASAINFELHALDPETSTLAIRKAANSLGWELHLDDDEDSEDEDDEDDDR